MVEWQPHNGGERRKLQTGNTKLETQCTDRLLFCLTHIRTETRRTTLSYAPPVASAVASSGVCHGPTCQGGSSPTSKRLLVTTGTSTTGAASCWNASVAGAAV